MPCVSREAWIASAVENPDSPAMLPSIPLTAEAEALQKQILAIPRTDEALDLDTPAELSSAQMEDLYHAAIEGANWVIPELKKHIARHPEFPTLLNYLMSAYQQRNQPRQARQVLKDLAKFHPDYLFTRIGLALDALETTKPDAVVRALGPALDITKLYPERDLFHVSELKNYYVCVAIHHARVGEPALACGVLAAIEEIDPGTDAGRVIEREILVASAKSLSERMRVDEVKRIEVKMPPLPKKITVAGQPSFHHEEINSLYDHSLAMPASFIREILALPRETVVADLIHVLDDSISRTPNFMSYDIEESEACAPVHALHFLAELDATESLEAVLRFLSLHTDALRFWFGTLTLSGEFARIIRGDLTRVTAWLKSPGISSSGKCRLTDAMAHLAQVEPALREEVVKCFGEVLAFVLASPREDNVLDTRFIALLVCNCIDVRATRLLPIINQAWEKGYIEEFMVGNIESITHDISAPPSPAPKTLSIFQRYQNDQQPDYSSAGSDFLESDETDDEPAPVSVGRNDPCPCGSGKKYKKCCMS
jgi:uncharacterized protein YchJ